MIICFLDFHTIVTILLSLTGWNAGDSESNLFRDLRQGARSRQPSHLGRPTVTTVMQDSMSWWMRSCSRCLRCSPKNTERWAICVELLEITYKASQLSKRLWLGLKEMRRWSLEKGNTSDFPWFPVDGTQAVVVGGKCLSVCCPDKEWQRGCFPTWFVWLKFANPLISYHSAVFSDSST